MSLYLIDYENVNADGLAGINQLDESDTIILFYSMNSNTLTFSLHKSLTETKARLEYVEVKAGTKNSLDFQLVSYLGYLIAKDQKSDYVIVSKDNGFSSTVAFWQNRKVEVSLARDLQNVRRESVEKELQKAIPDFEGDIPKITSILVKHNAKQSINAALVKEFGSEKAGTIYKSIRPLLASVVSK